MWWGTLRLWQYLFLHESFNFFVFLGQNQLMDSYLFSGLKYVAVICFVSFWFFDTGMVPELAIWSLFELTLVSFLHFILWKLYYFTAKKMYQVYLVLLLLNPWINNFSKESFLVPINEALSRRILLGIAVPRPSVEKNLGWMYEYSYMHTYNYIYICLPCILYYIFIYSISYFYIFYIIYLFMLILYYVHIFILCETICT